MLHSHVYVSITIDERQLPYQCNNTQFSILFSQFLTKAMSLLDKYSNDKLQLCKSFCYTLKISDVSKEPLFNDKDVERIDKCKNFTELFCSPSPLCRHYAWFEFQIIEGIIHTSELDEAKDELKKYKQHLKSNIKKPISSDVVQEDKLPPCSKKVLIILDRSHTGQITVEEYQKSSDAVLQSLKINNYALYHYLTFSEGSLHFTWYVPEQAACHMKKSAILNKSLLIKQSIMFIKVDKEVIFDHRLLKQQPVSLL